MDLHDDGGGIPHGSVLDGIAPATINVSGEFILENNRASSVLEVTHYQACGGAISVSGDLAILGSANSSVRLSGNAASSVSGISRGGAIYTSGSARVAANDITFSNNQADFGGAVWARKDISINAGNELTFATSHDDLYSEAGSIDVSAGALDIAAGVSFTASRDAGMVSLSADRLTVDSVRSLADATEDNLFTITAKNIVIGDGNEKMYLKLRNVDLLPAGAECYFLNYSADVDLTQKFDVSIYGPASVRSVVLNGFYVPKLESGVTPIDGLHWNGSGTAVWETGNSENKVWLAFGAEPSAFSNGDKVIFNGSVASAVAISGMVAPSSLKVTSGDYTFCGSGSITGATALVKSGSGTQTVTNKNTFTGGTSLTGGALVATNANALGFGTVSASAGTTLELALDRGDSEKPHHRRRFTQKIRCRRALYWLS